MVKKIITYIIGSMVMDHKECPDTEEIVDPSYCRDKCPSYKGIYRRSFRLHGLKNVIWWCRVIRLTPLKQHDEVILLDDLEIEFTV